ncbi:MAG TPA: sigma-70 family RNA polymerase sigma factor [Polyangiaceae bacterium]
MTILRWLRTAPRIQGLVPSALPLPSAHDTEPLGVAEIHARHADFVWRSLQRLGVRPADLEDALQEVFIVVFRRLETFDHRARLTTWLFGICLRVASAQRNRAYVRRERSGAEPDLLEHGADSEAQGLDDPERVLLENEARAELERLLDLLPPEKRATVVMFELEGMSAPEIAELTDVPVSTVYSRLGSARAELGAAAERARLREQHRAKTRNR